MMYLSRRICPDSTFVDKEGPRIKYVVRSISFQIEALGVTHLLILGEKIWQVWGLYSVII
jgi:hypothetical protein